MKGEDRWTGRDVTHLAAMTLVCVLFSVREGPFLEAGLMTLRYLLAYLIYGLVTVLIFIGLGKKLFKLKPTRKKIIKWSFGMAAFFAVNQAIHEAFLALTGQAGP